MKDHRDPNDILREDGVEALRAEFDRMESFEPEQGRVNGNGQRHHNDGDDDFAPDEPALKAKRKKPNGTKIARLPNIGEIEVRDVTPERVADYQEFFDHHAFRDFPAWRSCYCMESHRTQSDEEWAVRTGADNRRDMTAAINRGDVTALLAYVDGKPVGWCNYGETTALAGVMHRFELKAEDHDGVGSISCFVIAAPYRRHGVAGRLLDAAVMRLRERGVRAVEAYPVKSSEKPQSNYRGPLSMYLRAGFEPYREQGPFQFVRKQL